MATSEAGSAAWPGRLLGGGSSVSVIVATAIVVADMVGVGVFTSLGFQVKDIPSGFSILLLWILGGIVALCGVFSYAELGAMFPRSSGEYNFLGRAFHPAFGFMAGFVSATVGFAAPVALAAMAFGEYGTSVFPGASPIAHAAAEPAAFAARGNADRAGALCGVECRILAGSAGRQIVRPASGREHRRQLYLRRPRRSHRRRHDLHRTDFVDLGDDVDRSPR